jgi:hypothetical protein
MRLLRLVATPIVLGILVAVLLVPGRSWAQSDSIVAREVIDAIQGEGSARVMIAFSVAEMSGPERLELGTPDLGDRIDASCERILGDFAPGEFELRRRFRHVNALAGDLTESGLLRLLANPSVLRVDLDQGGSGQLDEARPLANVDAVQALGLTGAGITVAVLDSGYDTDHADLAGDLAAERCFCSGGGGCCPDGSSSQSGGGSAEDDHGHGTNVTGIITSTGSIAPVGGAPDAQIVAVKVLDNNNSFCCSSDVVAGLNWIINNQPGVDVVNMSLGTSTLYGGNCDNANAFNMAFATAIDTLRSNGVAVFVSSGNNGSGTQMQAPACVANSISVGAVWDSNVGSQTVLGCTDATTAADQVTCFSNSNATTDLFAPGAPATSTGFGGGTSTFFGTSQASPLAAACAALLLEDDPTLSPNDIEMALESSPTLVTDASNGLAFPRLDCLAALANQPPVAQCRDVTVSTDPGLCTAAASVDDGSFDPDGDPISSTQAPPPPYPLGTTDVTLTVMDGQGGQASCQGEVTVEDTEAPTVQCNATATIVPPDAPISFTASAADNCGVSTVVIDGFDCFSFTKKGKRIDKTGSCEVAIAGNTITIDDSGGVGDHIRWSVTATDSSGNPTPAICELVVANPGTGGP